MSCYVADASVAAKSYFEVDCDPEAARDSGQ